MFTALRVALISAALAIPAVGLAGVYGSTLLDCDCTSCGDCGQGCDCSCPNC